jgi:Fe-S cluster biosynthesis and repair protein YggX
MRKSILVNENQLNLQNSVSNRTLVNEVVLVVVSSVSSS